MFGFVSACLVVAPHVCRFDMCRFSLLVCRFALLISHWCIGNTEEKSLFVEQQSEEALNGLALPACGALAKACCS